ncbi:MAG: hypothetical protein IM483_08130, partial [Microcystis sp. M122S2]|uniref:hypothetical protein n=1 Tax=Microcystis sp. M122S2 TaxID=2771142 RepID=UPI00258E970E
MVTNTKQMTPYQMVFERPAKFFSFLLALVAIILNPSYNMMIVGGGFFLYMILYQLREYIYKLGISRFYLLGIIFYAFIGFSSLLDIEFDSKWSELFGNGEGIRQVWNLLSDVNYQNWFVANLDSLIHWKLLIFAPCAAVLFYILNVEFDRKRVKRADLEYLSISIDDLYSQHAGYETFFFLLSVYASLMYSYILAMLITLIIIACIGLNSVVEDAKYSIFIVLIAFIGFLYLSITNFNYEYVLHWPSLTIDLIGR